jgi:hypothetical protein
MDQIIKLVEALAWPVVSLIALLLLRLEIRRVVDAVAARAIKLTAGGVSVELAAGQLQNQALSQEATEEEKIQRLRALELAKGIASRFDTWMKRYNHPEQSDQMHLLDWLVADKGGTYTGDDYVVFKALAEVLSQMGYETLPPPTEGQFLAKVKENDLVLREWAQRKR